MQYKIGTDVYIDGTGNTIPVSVFTTDGAKTISVRQTNIVFQGSPTEFTFTLDTTAPTITLNEEPFQTIELGSTYNEQGADVADTGPTGATYTEITTITGTVDTNTIGTYIIRYNAPHDVAGNSVAEVTRTVNIVSPQTVSTTLASAITSTSVTLNGNIGSNVEGITSKGFVYSSSNTDLTIGATEVEAEVVTGADIFFKEIIGLTKNTQYYYKAYATNSTGTTTYGEEQRFMTLVDSPMVSIISASEITSTSAILNGRVTSDGGDTITETGFVYSLSNTDPEIGGVNVSRKIIGDTAYNFFKIIIDLTTNTQYYYKTYATNSAGITYGEVQHFMTLVGPPTVATIPTYAIDYKFATLYGNIISNGGNTVIERGFVYSSSNTNLEIGEANVHKRIVSSTATGLFFRSIKRLTVNTQYYYKAYATSSLGTTYGETQHFITLGVPIVFTEYEDESYTYATLKGLIFYNGESTIIETGFVYSSSNTDPEIGGINVSRKIIGDAEHFLFFKRITGLTKNTKYYCKSYATNSVGTAYGKVMHFTTLGAPIVDVASAHQITSTSASLRGIISI